MSLDAEQQPVWTRLLDTLDEQARIRTRAQKVVEILNLALVDGTWDHRIQLSFAAISDHESHLATIASSLGNGRLRFKWSVVDETLVGNIIVDRKQVDQYDVEYFEPVLTVVVPDRLDIFTDTSNGRHTFDMRSHFRGDGKRDVIDLALLMLYAVVAGKQ